MNRPRTAAGERLEVTADRVPPMPPMRRGRAAWRLGRCVVHALHGVAIVHGRFKVAPPAAREARIAWWSRRMLELLGIGLQVDGVPLAAGGLLVANHVSWLDILALHAVVPRARFVSKADVKAWPLLAALIDSAGTLYLERERKRDALRVVHHIADAIGHGELVAVFPEGTTADGHALLPFHANLLQAAVATGAAVQPVALRYADAGAAVSTAVEFIGATTLLGSLWRVANGERLRVHVALLAPLDSAGHGRQTLARQARDAIEQRLAATPDPRIRP